MWTRQLKHPYNDHVVYISGPHGSGKSTLVNRLKELAPDLEIQEQLAHLEQLEDMTERFIWRIALHAIEHRLNLAKAEAYPMCAVLGDRCYFDDNVYLQAFCRLGWVTRQQVSSYLKLTDQTYRLTGTPKPSRLILLCPPYEWNAERIRQRWEEGEAVKWNEGNFTYLRHINAEYHRVAARVRPNILVVRSTDLSARVSQIRTWLRSEVEPGRALLEAGRRTYRTQGAGSD